MLKLKMYDQIIHEHLEYYHLKPLEFLLNKNNLKIIKIQKTKLMGAVIEFLLKKIIPTLKKISQ